MVAKPQSRPAQVAACHMIVPPWPFAASAFGALCLETRPFRAVPGLFAPVSVPGGTGRLCAGPFQRSTLPPLRGVDWNGTARLVGTGRERSNPSNVAPNLPDCPLPRPRRFACRAHKFPSGGNTPRPVRSGGVGNSGGLRIRSKVSRSSSLKWVRSGSALTSIA
jgi:hypothetical protein